jgi:hypothetical protein
VNPLALLLLLIQVPIPPIDVNTATKAELMTIEGISPMVADHIIRDRPYKTVEDVDGGVPRFLFEKIRARITVTSVRAVTPNPVIPQPQHRQIQVISGNKIDKVQFEARPQEKGAEVPPTNANSPR